MVKSTQGNRVQQELEALRQKHLTKDKRDKLQDISDTPLTTPEEAKAFLATMRDKSHQRDAHKHPPSNITTSDGMEAWHHQQRQREKELRQRRREAEALLRGYRGGRDSIGGRSSIGAHSVPLPRESLGYRDDISVVSSAVPTNYIEEEAQEYFLNQEHNDDEEYDARSQKEEEEQQQPMHVQTSRSPGDIFPPSLRSTSSVHSENLDDPRCFRQTEHMNDNMNDPHRDQPPVKTDLLEDLNISDEQCATPEEATSWLDFITSEPGAKFPPEAGRYHLYLSYACPGSHRVLIVRTLKGLENVIDVTFVHPTWRLTRGGDDKHRGWVFGDPNGEPFSNTIGRGGPFPPAYRNTGQDPLFDAYSVRDIYEAAGDTSGKFTIPFLWDKVHNTIVNNESSDIAYMLNSCFNDFAENRDLDLYTEFDEDGVIKLNEVSEWLSPLMIHGVYRCGFAKNQRAYDRAIAELCEAFDRADDILQKQRYLTGNDTITDADIRLFVSLIRYDEVYSVYFRANARLVMLTPSLLNFCREIYQMRGVADTCDITQIKAHFFGSHAEWNKYSIIPRGLGFMELLDMPHDREVLEDDEVEFLQDVPQHIISQPPASEI